MVRERVAELLALMPGMSFDNVMDMYWRELAAWHGAAVSVAKKIRGAR